MLRDVKRYSCPYSSIGVQYLCYFEELHRHDWSKAINKNIDNENNNRGKRDNHGDVDKEGD